MTRRKDWEEFLKTGGALGGGLGEAAFSGRGAPTFEIGQQIGKVRIVGTVGSGGMGDVFLGVDTRLNRKVAVKTLLTGHHLTPSMRQRFLNEFPSGVG